MITKLKMFQKVITKIRRKHCMKKKYLFFGLVLLPLTLSGCTFGFSNNNGANHEHTFRSEWTYDKDKHWHEASCGHDVRSKESDHVFASVVTEPTYESGGYTTYTCEICNYSYRGNETPKLTESGGEALKKYEYNEIENGQTVDGEYSQFVNINVLSSYLGYGYDVINDPYMKKDYINMSAPILDTNKLYKANLRLIKENIGESYTSEGDDMESMIDSYSAKFDVEVGVKSGRTKVFSSGLKSSFKGSSEVKTFLKFYKNVYQVRTFNLYLTDSLTKIKNMVSDEFYEDVNQLSANSLFNKYGTHLIKEAAMGGRLELNSVWSSNEVGYSSDITASVSAHINALSIVGIDTTASASIASKLNSKGVRSEITGQQVGGRLVDVSTAESMAKNKQAWLDSLNDDLSVSALSGIVGENSLVPLWDLLPDNMQAKKEELHEVFIKNCEDKYDEICDLYKLNKNREVKVIYDSEQGVVEGNESPYLDGKTVELYARPKNNNQFYGWLIDGELVSQNQLYSFKIHVDTTLEARFIKVDPEHTHTFSTNWTYDDNYHWHAATCEHSDLKDGLSEHSYNNEYFAPTKTSNGYTKYTCKVCGYYYTKEDTSTKAVWTADMLKTALEDNNFSNIILIDNINCSGRGYASFADELTTNRTIDGNGYKIYNWEASVDSTSNSNQYIGLVKINRGTIKNITFENCKLSIGSKTIPEAFGGMACGENIGTIENIIVTNCNIHVDTGTSATSKVFRAFAGGIAGRSSGTITKCGSVKNYVYGWTNSKAAAYAYAGGIAGDGCGRINNCYSRNSNTKYGTYKIWAHAEGNNGFPHAGGLLGQAHDLTMSNCISYGNTITAEKSSHNSNRIGSIFGFGYNTDNIVLSTCYSENEDLLFGAGQSYSGAYKLGSNESMRLSVLSAKGFDTTYWTEKNNEPVISYTWKV